MDRVDGGHKSSTKPPSVGRVRAEIDLIQTARPKDRIRNNAGVLIERPALFAHKPSTTESEIAFSRCFSARKIKVLCAQGHASET